MIQTQQAFQQLDAQKFRIFDFVFHNTMGMSTAFNIFPIVSGENADPCKGLKNEKSNIDASGNNGLFKKLKKEG